MKPLNALLAQLAREGFRLEALGGHIAVKPKDRLTPELRDEIIRYRADVLALLRRHGPGLLNLFRDCPSWPPSCGRSGVLADPDAVFRAIGQPIRLRDGRIAILRAVLYDTRTGRLRCCVEPDGAGRELFDPEDLDQWPGQDAAGSLSAGGGGC